MREVMVGGCGDFSKPINKDVEEIDEWLISLL